VNAGTVDDVGENHHACGQTLETCGRGDARCVKTGEVTVHDRDVGSMLAESRECRDSVRGLGHELDVLALADAPSKAASEDRVVVGEPYANASSLHPGEG
jgi:hypothetical protein